MDFGAQGNSERWWSFQATSNVKSTRIRHKIVSLIFLESNMGNKIVTEADRKRTPAPKPLPGNSARTGGRGQRVSLERGVATRSKKNPGKRASKGG